MKKCKQITRLISQRQDNRLNTIQQFELKSHLLICRHCRAYARQLDFIQKALDKQF